MSQYKIGLELDELQSTTSSPTKYGEDDEVLDILDEEMVNIDNNIQGETNLIEYTETHFANNRIHEEYVDIGPGPRLENRVYSLDDIRDVDFENLFHQNYIRSDSPVSMTHRGSNSNSDVEDDPQKLTKRRSSYRLFANRDIERRIQQYYSDRENKYSSELDILTTFIKGQKNIYIRSKYFIQVRLNYLRLPCLFLAAALTMIVPFIECEMWSRGVISVVNAAIAFLISVIHYLKLDSSIEMFLQIANQYDKLETSLEMANSRLSFLENDHERGDLVLNKIKELEKKIGDIKEAYKILIPEEIRRSFPIICHINIFSLIKKIETHRKNIISKFRDIKNEIRYILYRQEKANMSQNMSQNMSSSLETQKEQNRLLFLYEIKEKIKVELAYCQNIYGDIDEIFIQEIKKAEEKKGVGCWPWPSKQSDIGGKPYWVGKNPVLDNYLHI
jgi:hypothetical protein